VKKYLIVVEKQSGVRETHFETDDKEHAEQMYKLAVGVMGRDYPKRGSNFAVALCETVSFQLAAAPQIEMKESKVEEVE
jgi:hypothetical protein